MAPTGHPYTKRVATWKTALHWGWNTVNEFERMSKVVRDAVFDRFEYQKKIIELLCGRTSEPCIRSIEGHGGKKAYYLDYHPRPSVRYYWYRHTPPGWKRESLSSDLVENPEKITDIHKFLGLDVVSQAEGLLRS